MMKLDISAMEYQMCALLDFDTKFVGVSGGKRSGKSRMITVLKSIILSSLHPGKPGLVASPVYGMTRRNLLPLYRDLAEKLGIQIEGLNVKSPDCLKIKWGDNEPSVIWLDCTIENFGRMNGLSLAWGIGDEMDKARYEDAEAFVEELIIRCSNPAPGRIAQINLTGAPELNGYMAEFFLEKAAPNKKLFKWSMMMNEYLSDEYKETILASIPEKKRAGWVHGEFMFNADGLVYDSYDPTVNACDITLADWKQGDKVDVCWDINDGGTSVVFRIRRGKFTYYVNEWMKMKDTEAVLARLKKMKTEGKPWAQVLTLSCDPACTQVFTYIHKACAETPGWTHAIMKEAPDISWRVTAVNNRFGTFGEYNPGVKKPHCQVNPKTCKVLNRCLIRQGYVKGVPDKKTWIEDAGTDISGPIDAFGYLEYRDFPYHPHNPNRPIAIRGF